MSAPRIDRGLAALLRSLARDVGGRFHIREARTMPWASATFEGARHEVMLEFDGDDAPARVDAIARRLPEIDFALARHLVADIHVVATAARSLAFETLILAAG